MNNNTTELVFILDKSGSMAGLEEDTIGGFNALLEKQKKEEGKTYVTTVMFNNRPTFVHGSKDLMSIKPLTSEDYRVGGSTALLDAIGETINKVSNRIMVMDREKPSKVLCVITTDGLENSSREYSYARIKELVEAKTKEGWEFIFLGANIDSFSVATSLGIKRSNTSNYVSDSDGTKLNFLAMNFAIQSFRKGEIDPSWNKEVEDYNKEKENDGDENEGN